MRKHEHGANLHSSTPSGYRATNLHFEPSTIRRTARCPSGYHVKNLISVTSTTRCGAFPAAAPPGAAGAFQQFQQGFPQAVEKVWKAVEKQLERCGEVRKIAESAKKAVWRAVPAGLWKSLRKRCKTPVFPETDRVFHSDRIKSFPMWKAEKSNCRRVAPKQPRRAE